MTENLQRVFPCPRCRKGTKYDIKNDFRPFCSRACKDDDTIAWADGNYSVAGEEAEPEEIIDALRSQNKD